MHLAEFAAWVIEQGPFSGCDLEGGEVQLKATELGLLVETNYDPSIHEDTAICDVEPGDPWYVFSDDMKAALASATGQQPMKSKATQS